MKTYNTKKDKYGLVIGAYDFLCDTRMLTSGTKGELLFWMRAWNFVAKIVNVIKGIKIPPKSKRRDIK